MDILKILDNKNISYKYTNDPSEVILNCTNPEHEDNNPSLHYNLSKNVFYCFSCGFKGGPSKFLSSIGIVTTIPVETPQDIKIKKLKAKLSEKTERIIRLPNDMRLLSDMVFRGVTSNILKEFQVFRTNKYNLYGYVCVPVYQYNRLKWIEGRNEKTQIKNRPKYYRYPKGVSASKVIFPLDKCKENKIILVEGIWDMLRLYKLGYSVGCIFGTTNFSNHKVNLLINKGITNVTLMMDGDDAGRRATGFISSLLEKNNISCNSILLNEGEDPSNVQVSRLRELLK